MHCQTAQHCTDCHVVSVIWYWTVWKHPCAIQHANQFVHCVTFPKYKCGRKPNCSKIIRSKVRKCIHEVHLEWLNRAYHIIRWYAVHSLSIRSSLLLTVILISSLLNSSCRPACNSCRHATLWLRYTHSARAHNDCKQQERAGLELDGAKVRNMTGRVQAACLTGDHSVTGLHCTC